MATLTVDLKEECSELTCRRVTGTRDFGKISVRYRRMMKL